MVFSSVYSVAFIFVFQTNPTQTKPNQTKQQFMAVPLSFGGNFFDVQKSFERFEGLFPQHDRCSLRTYRSYRSRCVMFEGVLPCDTSYQEDLRRMRIGYDDGAPFEVAVRMMAPVGYFVRTKDDYIFFVDQRLILASQFFREAYESGKLGPTSEEDSDGSDFTTQYRQFLDILYVPLTQDTLAAFRVAVASYFGGTKTAYDNAFDVLAVPEHFRSVIFNTELMQPPVLTANLSDSPSATTTTLVELTPEERVITETVKVYPFASVDTTRPLDRYARITGHVDSDQESFFPYKFRSMPISRSVSSVWAPRVPLDRLLITVDGIVEVHNRVFVSYDNPDLPRPYVASVT